MKKKYGLIFLMIAMVFSLSLAGCGKTESKSSEAASGKDAKTGSEASKTSASNMSPEIAKIYEAAKKEGKVVFWSPDDVEIPHDIEVFQKKYPGIKVEHFEIQPQPALQKIIAEDSAGQTNVDVFDVYYNDLKQLTDRNLAMSFDYNKVFGLDPSIIKGNNTGLVTWHLDFPIVYNTNLVKKEELPKSWEDLLDPKWKGKIIVEARGNAFPILSNLWGEEKTIKFVNDLMKQNPIVIKGGTPTSQAITNGQGSFAIGTYSYKIENLKKKGAPVDWARVGPMPLITHISGALKKAPHPNAALLFAAFLASGEGLKTRAEGGGGWRMEGVDVGKPGEELKKLNIKTVSEDPSKQEMVKKVEKEVSKILSSVKK